MIDNIINGTYGKADVQVLLSIACRFINNDCQPVVITNDEIAKDTKLSVDYVRKCTQRLVLNDRSLSRETTLGNHYKYMLDLDKFGVFERQVLNDRSNIIIYLINKESNRPEKQNRAENQNRSQLTGDEDVDRFIANYYRAYKERYQVSLATVSGKNQWHATVNTARAIVKDSDVDKLIALTNLFFSKEYSDDWVDGTNRSLAVFRSQIPKLVEYYDNKKKIDKKKLIEEWDGQL